VIACEADKRARRDKSSDRFVNWTFQGMTQQAWRDSSPYRSSNKGKKDSASGRIRPCIDPQPKDNGSRTPAGIGIMDLILRYKCWYRGRRILARFCYSPEFPLSQSGPAYIHPLVQGFPGTEGSGGSQRYRKLANDWSKGLLQDRCRQGLRRHCPASRQQTVEAVVVKTRPLVNILESAALLSYGLVVLLLSSMPMVL